MPPALVRAAAEVPTPAVLYDPVAIDDAVTTLRDDLGVIPDVRLSFAVKANRYPPVLEHFARLGLGADIASSAEFDLATAAGISPLTATAPGLAADDMSCLHHAGVAVNLSSVSQLRTFGAAVGPGADVGLRVRIPVSPAERSGTGIEWSRFGVDPADPDLHGLLADADMTVTRLHAHSGEVLSATRARQLTVALLTCASHFPEVTTLNLGGGLAGLYARPAEARTAWRMVAAALDQFAADHGRRFRVVVEPGMLLTALAGYLVVSVRAVDPHPAGHRVATVDASAWNLLSWTSPRLMARIPERGPAVGTYAVAGATCYEEDYVTRETKAGELRVGDRLVFNAAGAYVTSTARSMHGLPAPYEAVVGPEGIVA